MEPFKVNKKRFVSIPYDCNAFPHQLPTHFLRITIGERTCQIEVALKLSSPICNLIDHLSEKC